MFSAIPQPAWPHREEKWIGFASGYRFMRILTRRRPRNMLAGASSANYKRRMRLRFRLLPRIRGIRLYLSIVAQSMIRPAHLLTTSQGGGIL
jgi:hypothetical protein